MVIDHSPPALVPFRAARWCHRPLAFRWPDMDEREIGHRFMLARRPRRTTRTQIAHVISQKWQLPCTANHSMPVER
jgi:hypothetical protein